MKIILTIKNVLLLLLIIQCKEDEPNDQSIPVSPKEPSALELQKAKLFTEKLVKQRQKVVSTMKKDARIVKKFEPRQGEDVFLQWMSFISKYTQEKSAELQKLELTIK